jgi:hypothetical protein
VIIPIHLVERGDAGPFSINLQVQLVVERQQASECEAVAKREGEYSYEKCWRRFTEAMDKVHEFSVAEAETTPAAVEASEVSS